MNILAEVNLLVEVSTDTVTASRVTLLLVEVEDDRIGCSTSSTGVKIVK